MSLAFQAVAPRDYFEFAPDCVLDADHGVHLEYKCGEHRAKLVNREWIVALHQHMPTPLAHTNYEKLDLEIGWCLPLAKHLQDSLLGILILYRDPCGRSNQLIMYFMYSPFYFLNGRTDHIRLSLLVLRVRAGRALPSLSPEETGSRICD